MKIEFKENELREKIFKDELNRLVFSAGLGSPVYLVGGYLRDMLRGVVNTDRDYVIGGDYELLLRQVVLQSGGKLIRLGGYLSRIVLRDYSTLDFSPLVNDIRDDLSRRDFTVNSLAWSPDSGIVDPYEGLEDLRREIIRMISGRNFEQDPVRILRAYRFAGELSFNIDRNTRKVIKELCHKITEAKSERITLEFFKILNVEDARRILAMMACDGALQHLLSTKKEELYVKLRVFSRVEEIFNALPLMYKKIICEKCPRNLSCLGMMRLEFLLEGMSSFPLSLSAAIVRKLQLIERAKELLPAEGWSHDDIFEAFSLMGDASSIDFLIMKDRPEFLPEFERYRLIKKYGLVSTKEIMGSSVLLKGKRLGEVIKMLKKAEFNYEIKSRDEAFMLLQRQCGNLT